MSISISGAYDPAYTTVSVVPRYGSNVRLVFRRFNGIRIYGPVPAIY